MGYIYELHSHTNEVSKCSKISGAELVRFYYNKGYSGVCITDHFFNGNTLVPKDLPWKEKVEWFYRGYYAAKEEGEKLGIDVFDAWEYTFRGTDILTYGLSKEWLLERDDILDYEIFEYCDIARENGAYVVHAHPFQDRSYNNIIRLMPHRVDAVEIFNACRSDFENKMAGIYATEYGLSTIGASDNHLGELPHLYAMEFDHKMNSLNEIISALRENKGKIVEL